MSTKKISREGAKGAKPDNYGIPQQVLGLVHTSVDDAHSRLWHWTAADLNDLRKAHELCVYQGQKTKATIIARRIRQLEKGGGR
ncbi:MAG TPA: hypothetical protein VN496_00505 [Burkholderiales bacterium]|nr:hypothetical protein [Burkholderiales bacterium]